MTTTTSQLHLLKNAIVDGLHARAGLTRVQVTSAYLGKNSAAESIQFAHGDDLDQDWSQLGRLEREERLVIKGLVWVMKPGGSGAGTAAGQETVIRDTRGRAFALLAEVEDFLRGDPSIGGLVKTAQIVPIHNDEGFNPKGRTCQVDFEIRCMNRLRSS